MARNRFCERKAVAPALPRAPGRLRRRSRGRGPLPRPKARPHRRWCIADGGIQLGDVPSRAGTPSRPCQSRRTAGASAATSCPSATRHSTICASCSPSPRSGNERHAASVNATRAMLHTPSSLHHPEDRSEELLVDKCACLPNRRCDDQNGTIGISIGGAQVKIIVMGAGSWRHHRYGCKERPEVQVLERMARGRGNFQKRLAGSRPFTVLGGARSILDACQIGVPEGSGAAVPLQQRPAVLALGNEVSRQLYARQLSGQYSAGAALHDGGPVGAQGAQCRYRCQLRRQRRGHSLPVRTTHSFEGAPWRLGIAARARA